MEDFEYMIVCEQTSPEDAKCEILEVKENLGNLQYLRFRSCMQDFGTRNRNGRLWQAKNMKIALKAAHILELQEKKDLAGENGHPIPPVGTASMARIMTIDPNNVCHTILNFQWEGDSRVYSDIETIDDGNGPGNKFARSILQGMEPAFSVRSVVPQKRNSDGSIDVTGPGRVITYDRVFLPSHKAAYRDVNVAVKKVVSKGSYESVMESLGLMAYEMSDRAKYAAGDTVAIESITMDKSGLFMARNADGIVAVPLEKKVRSMIHGYMKDFNI